MRRRTHPAAWFVRVAMCAALLGVALAAAPPPPAGAGAGTRYLDPVFDQVLVTDDLVYGRAPTWVGTLVDLRLDLYEPAGDVATARPAVVVVHGGSFAGGSKSDPLEVDWGTDLARRGYVAVSIQYRLRIGPSEGAIRDAQHDAQAAVRWLRANATSLRVDPARIGISGYSAGGVTAIEVAQSSHDTGASGNPGYSSWVCFAASQAGATIPDVDARDTPVAFFHGTADTVVPTALARLDHQAWVAAGIPTWFWSYDGDHLAPLANTADVRAKLYPLLEEYLVRSPCAEPPPVSGGSLHPVAARLGDSRIGAPLGPGETRDVAVAGRFGVPPGARTVLVNVTAVAPTASTRLSVSSAGATATAVAALPVTAGETRAGLALVGLSTAGTLTLRNDAGSTHAVVDLVAWFDGGAASSTGGRVLPVAPVRIADSRRAVGLSGPIGPRAAVDLPSGASPGAEAIVANVTLVGPSDATHVTASAPGQPRPPTSSVNAAAGATVANLAVAPLASGRTRLFNLAGQTPVVVDVLAEVRPTGGAGPAPSSPTGRVTATPPTRVLDSRSGVGTRRAPLGAGEVRSIDVRGLGGLPPGGIAAVVLSVSASDATGPTHLTVTAGGAPADRTSNLNVVAGREVANLVVVAVGPDGTVSVRNSTGSTQVALDTVGFVAV